MPVESGRYRRECIAGQSGLIKGNPMGWSIYHPIKLSSGLRRTTHALLKVVNNTRRLLLDFNRSRWRLKVRHLRLAFIITAPILGCSAWKHSPARVFTPHGHRRIGPAFTNLAGILVVIGNGPSQDIGRMALFQPKFAVRAFHISFWLRPDDATHSNEQRRLIHV